MGATDNKVCPVKAMPSYLAMRGDQTGPTKEGKGLTHQTFNSAADTLLSQLEVNHKHYNAHSFRIGAATSAVQARIPDSQIKMLGHWQSDAYLHYIKTPSTELASYQRSWHLASSNCTLHQRTNRGLLLYSCM